MGLGSRPSQGTKAVMRSLQLVLLGLVCVLGDPDVFENYFDDELRLWMCPKRSYSRRVSPMEMTLLKRSRRRTTNALAKITALTILPTLLEEIQTMTIFLMSMKEMKRASIRLWVGYKERTLSLLWLRLIWLEFQISTASRITSTNVQLGLATLVGAKRGRLERPLRKMRRCPVLWNLVMELCNG